MKIDADAIYSVEEAAALVRRGPTFIYELCKAKKLSHHRPTRNSILIRGKDLQAWLDANYIKSVDTPSCEAGPRDTTPSGTQTPSEKQAAAAVRSALVPTSI